MKSNLFYVYENTSKVDRRECGYHDRTTALCVLEYLLDKLYGTGKTVIFYDVRTGERKEYKA